MQRFIIGALVVLFVIALLDSNAFNHIIGLLGNTVAQILFTVLSCEPIVFLLIIAGVAWFFLRRRSA